jgi:hypothetical protein
MNLNPFNCRPYYHHYPEADRIAAEFRVFYAKRKEKHEEQAKGMAPGRRRDGPPGKGEQGDSDRLREHLPGVSSTPAGGAPQA